MSAHSLKDIGIVFTSVEERYQLVLDKWIAALRKKNHGTDALLQNEFISHGTVMTRQPGIRVLLVDDFVPWIGYVSTTLEASPDYQIVGQASDGLAAVQIAQTLRPDLILLDIGLPNLNGLEAAKRISLLSPASKILFVSAIRDSNVVESALSEGAGYVLKSDGRSELLAGIEAVLQGKRFVSRGLINVSLLTSSFD